MHALGLEFGSAAQLSKRPGSVWNCLWGNALKRSPGIIRKSRVSYPGPGFLSSATWLSLPKKHYNGLNQTKPNQTGCHSYLFLSLRCDQISDGISFAAMLPLWFYVDQLQQFSLFSTFNLVKLFISN